MNCHSPAAPAEDFTKGRNPLSTIGSSANSMGRRRRSTCRTMYARYGRARRTVWWRFFRCFLYQPISRTTRGCVRYGVDNPPRMRAQVSERVAGSSAGHGAGEIFTVPGSAAGTSPDRRLGESLTRLRRRGRLLPAPAPRDLFFWPAPDAGSVAEDAGEGKRLRIPGRKPDSRCTATSSPGIEPVPSSCTNGCPGIHPASTNGDSRIARQTRPRRGSRRIERNRIMDAT